MKKKRSLALGAAFLAATGTFMVQQFMVNGVPLDETPFPASAQNPYATEVVATHIFYNNSAFDTVSDDAAIASDKVALRPGETAAFKNYTSYDKGINGIMVDVKNSMGPVTFQASDFTLKSGNTADPGTWTDIGAPDSFTVRAAQGVNGADRIVLTLANNRVQKTWLQVTVKPSATNKLTQSYIFYYGNAIGETGTVAGNAQVTGMDQNDIRNNPTNFTNPATVTNQYDINRDKTVSGADQNIARNNTTNFLTALKLISAPAQVPTGNLFVSQDYAPLRNRQLLGGEVGNSVMNLKFRSQGEAIEVTDLRITSSGSNASSVDVLELYTTGATTPFAIASRAGCPTKTITVNPGDFGIPVRTFCADMNNKQLVVPKDSEVTVLVRPRLFNDELGAQSNQILVFWINKQESVVDNGSGAILARGVSSMNDLSANNRNTVADGEIFIGPNAPSPYNFVLSSAKNLSVLSKVESIANANSAADGTAIATGLLPFGQFAFNAAYNVNTANGYNKVSLSGVIFNVQATNVAIDAGSFKIYNKENPTVKSTCSAFNAQNLRPDLGVHSGSLLVSCVGLISNPVVTEISPHERVTLVLEANILNANTSLTGINSELQASLTNYGTVGSVFGIVSSSYRSTIFWHDVDSTIRGMFNWIEIPENLVKSTLYRG